MSRNNTTISATKDRAGGSPVYAVRSGEHTRGFVQRANDDSPFGKWTGWCKTCLGTVRHAHHLSEAASAVLDHWAVEHR